MRGGGAERVTSLLAHAWMGMGHQVSVVTIEAQSPTDYILEPAIASVALGLAKESRSLVGAIAANWNRIVALRRHFLASQPDVAIGMMPTCSVLSALAAFGLRVCVVASERIYPPMAPIGWMWGVLRRLVYPRMAMVVAQTHKGATWLRSHCNCSRTAIIGNPVLWPLPRRESVPHATVLSTKGRRVLLAVGRLDRQKGFDLLIEAFAQVAARHPDWDLLIAGEGPERETLLTQSQETPFGSRMKFLGRIVNIQDWYERADLFVLSSRFEGFPNALAEAMSYGCAAISFDCDTGPSDLIEHGVNGILVPLDHGATGLAAAIDECLQDPQRRDRLGQCATQIRDRFALPRIAEQWEHLLQAVCQGTSHEPAGREQTPVDPQSQDAR
jgi:glycosyltransferase involved in cell wall biosynthesis